MFIFNREMIVMSAMYMISFILCLLSYPRSSQCAWNLNIRIISKSIRSAMPSIIPFPKKLLPATANANAVMDVEKQFNFTRDSRSYPYSVSVGSVPMSSAIASGDNVLTDAGDNDAQRSHNNRTMTNTARSWLRYSHELVTLKPVRIAVSNMWKEDESNKVNISSTSFHVIDKELKPGIFGTVSLTYRRRFLTLWDRSHPWAKSVSRDDRIAKYYNSPTYRQDLKANRFIKAKNEAIVRETEESRLKKLRRGISSAVGRLNPFRRASTAGVSQPDILVTNPTTSHSDLNVFSPKRSSKPYDRISQPSKQPVTPTNTKGSVRSSLVNQTKRLPDEISSNGISDSMKPAGGIIPSWVTNSPVKISKAVGQAIVAASTEIAKLGEGYRELDVPHILSRDTKLQQQYTCSIDEEISPTIQIVENNATLDNDTENRVSSVITEASPESSMMPVSSTDSNPSTLVTILSASSKIISVAFPITTTIANHVNRLGRPQPVIITDSKPDAEESISSVDYNYDSYVISPTLVIPEAPTSISTPALVDTNSNPFSFINGALSAVISYIPWPKPDKGQGETYNLLDGEALTQYDPIEKLQDKINAPYPLLTGNRSRLAFTTNTQPSSSQTASKSNTNVKGDANALISLIPADPISSTSRNSQSGISIDIGSNLNVRLGRSEELKLRPNFLDNDGVPLPTKADFAHINSRRVAVAVAAALVVKSEQDAKDYLNEIGLKPLFTAMLTPSRPENRVDAILGMCRLMRQQKSVAASAAAVPGFLGMLCDLIELPLRGFLSFKSPQEREKDLRAQYEAVALIKRMVRSSDEALVIMRNDQRLKKVLAVVVVQGELASTGGKLVNSTAAMRPSGNGSSTTTTPTATTTAAVNGKRKSSNPTIVDLVDLKTHEMARVAAWGLGGVSWKPKQPGQKGLRILSFDGGGTRGVLSIALLKELMLRVGKSSPSDMFDIICGTSTGGIIAGLLGILRTRVDDSETMYDELIDKVFGSKSNLKLVTEQAFYNEVEFEKILYKLCGDELMLDSNQHECPRVFFVSTKVNVNPPQIQLWRNYNYPPGQTSRYNGEFRVNTRMAVRATTAAPTYFTPVQFEGGLYCDGALVANNPTAIALQEAKVLYPNVPVELVVSIGTGFSSKNSSVQSMGWDLLVNQLIASSTDTEDVNSLLVDFLPADKYFRLNPVLENFMAIDERNKTALLELKRLAKQTWRDIDIGPDAKRFEQLIKMLKGAS